MHYFIKKDKYEGYIIFINYNKSKGYKVNPKGKLENAIYVNEMTIIKPSLIKKIIKRKIRIMLETIESESDSDARIALGDIERYRKIINKKYSIYLDDKYMMLLNQKMDILERECKNNIKDDIYYEYEEEVSKKR